MEGAQLKNFSQPFRLKAILLFLLGEWQLVLAAVLFVLFVSTRGPGIYQNFKLEEQSLNGSVEVLDLAGNRQEIRYGEHPMLLVFWATWCGPCKLELNRINRLIKQGELGPALKVISVVYDEKPELVQMTAQDRGYQFPVVLDHKGLLTQNFKVHGTPTLVLLNAQGGVEWVSTGVSASLELRLKNFSAL